MSTYAAGFDAGERTAFDHRKQNARLIRPVVVEHGYQMGFWDGYTPRAAYWDRAARAATVADEAVCQEAEHA